MADKPSACPPYDFAAPQINRGFTTAPVKPCSGLYDRQKKPDRDPVFLEPQALETHAVMQGVGLAAIVGLFKTGIGIVDGAQADFLSGEAHAEADAILELEG